jgi:hypothetical protein
VISGMITWCMCSLCSMVCAISGMVGLNGGLDL